MSTPEEFIPLRQKMLAVFLNKVHDRVDLHAAETACALQDNGIKPNLCDFLFTFHMDVRWFASIQGDEEKPISIKS